MKFAFWSDLVFVFFATAFPALCLFRYLRLSLPLSALLSVACGAVVLVPVYYFENKKRRKKLQNAEDVREKEDLMLHFAVSPTEDTLRFFYGFYLSDFPNAKLKKNLKTRDAIETENELIFPLFTVAPLSGENALSVLRARSDKTKTVLCGSVSDEAVSLFSRFSVNVKTGDEIYLTLKKRGALPENFLLTPEKKNTKEKLLDKMRRSLSRSRAKPMFIGGALLLFSSLLTPFPYYYLVFGILLVVSSLFVRFFGLR